MNNEQNYAKDKQSTPEQVRSAVSDVAADAKDKLLEGGQELKAQAEAIASDIKEQTKSTVRKGKNQVATQIQGLANALNHASDTLDEENQDQLAYYSYSLGTQVEQVATYLEGKSVNELTDDLEVFARRQPAVFLGGALAVGLVAARFLRSSSPESSPNLKANPTYGSYTSSEVR